MLSKEVAARTELAERSVRKRCETLGIREIASEAAEKNLKKVLDKRLKM